MSETGGAVFDDFITLVGEQGKWQLTVYLYVLLQGSLMGMNHLASLYLAGSPEHWCTSTELHRLNWTSEEIRDLSIPRESQGGLLAYSQCQIYDRNYSDYIGKNWSQVSEEVRRENGSSTVKCNKWHYEHKYYGDTVATEWDLVCHRKPLLASIQGSYMCGVLTGSILFGIISDKIGRRRTMLLCTILLMLSGISVSFSTNYNMFITLRFFVAMSVIGLFCAGFVLVMEIMGPRWRSIMGALFQIPFAVGIMVLSGFAYLLRHWTWIQIGISVPNFLLIMYFWVIPESPHWLMVNGRVDEAFKILQVAAEKNGKSIPTEKELANFAGVYKENKMNTNKESTANTKKKFSFIDMFSSVIHLFRTREMRKRTLITFYTWMVVALVSYGLIFSLKNIHWDPYIMLFISAIIEIVGYIAIFPLVSRFGRKACYIAVFLEVAVICFMLLAVPLDIIWLTFTLSMFGRLGTSGAFSIVYLYTSELFPTVVRNTAVGGGDTCCRLGSIFAPYIVNLLGDYHHAIPNAIFGSCSLLAALLCFFLPETLGQKLPVTVEDVENWKPSKLPEGEEGRDNPNYDTSEI